MANEAVDEPTGLMSDGQLTDAGVTELLTGEAGSASDENKPERKELPEEESSGEEVLEEDENDEETNKDEEGESPAEESKLDEIAEDTWESVLGVDEGKLNIDDKGNLVGINVKVDGEVSTVDMTSLIAGYQSNKSNTGKSQAMAEERKVFTKERQEVVDLYRTKLNDVDAMNQYFEKQLISDFEGINWQELRVENPAEYAALKQDYASRAQDIQAIKETVSQANQQEQDKLNGQNSEERKQRLSSEFDKMLVNNPTWSDKVTFNKDMGKLKEFCSSQYGFSDEDFKSVGDSRLIELIKDASKYHSGVKFADKKLSKKVPKFQKSKGVPSKTVTKLQKLTSAAKKASGAQKRDLQASAVAELLTGG